MLSIILLSWLAQSVFLYKLRPLAQGGFTHSGQDPPISIVNQENAPQTYLQASVMEEIPQLLFSPKHVRLCQVDKN